MRIVNDLGHFTRVFLKLSLDTTKRVYPMQKILLPTDFSENAQNAIDYALLLFKNGPCTFYLLHAYHDATSSSISKKDMEKNLDQMVKTLNDQNKIKGHVFESVLLTESVVNAINITFVDKSIDYVIMGSQGSSALREIFLGSNTVSVIKYIERCPLIVVPTQYKFDIPKEIVFATDYKHVFVVPELSSLIAFSKLWLSKISVMHIDAEEVLTDAQKSNKKLLSQGLRRIEHNFLKVQKETSLADTLLSLGKEDKKIAVVAMIRTKPGFFENLLREPVINKMAFQTEIPFLVLPLLQ